MNSTSGRSTPTTYNRQPRLQIPSSLPSLLQTELLLFDRILHKNKPQHRSGLFHQKCTHVLRVMKRIAVEVSEIVEVNDGGTGTPTEHSLAKSLVKTVDTKVGGKGVDEKRSKRLYKTMTELINRALPALTKAFEVLEKMINHLHFLPLSTTLLAITSRLFVITIDISAYVIQYQSAAQDLSSTGQSGVNSPRTNFKEKNRDTAHLQLEDVVGMMVSGRMPSVRISVAQEQLEAKLSALQESTATRTTQSIVEPSTSKATMMEMEGEDFGEAVALPRRATSPRLARSAVVPPTPVVPFVLDPPSSPEEIIVAPLPIRKRIPGSTEIRRIPAELGPRTVPTLQISPTNVFDLTRSVAEQVTSSPAHTIKKTKGKKRPADGETTFTTQPTERASLATVIKDASRSDSKVNKKKKKGKDLMDDIFGL